MLGAIIVNNNHMHKRLLHQGRRSLDGFGVDDLFRLFFWWRPWNLELIGLSETIADMRKTDLNRTRPLTTDWEGLILRIDLTRKWVYTVETDSHGGGWLGFDGWIPVCACIYTFLLLLGPKRSVSRFETVSAKNMIPSQSLHYRTPWQSYGTHPFRQTVSLVDRSCADKRSCEPIANFRGMQE